MKITLLLLFVCLAVALGSPVHTRQNKGRILINRPKIDEFGVRDKRSSWAGVKGHGPVKAPVTPLELTLRKGEYICGNRVCKLEPGVVPPGCNGVCQYPL